MQLQSEMDDLELRSFIPRHNYTDAAHVLTKMVYHINAWAPQLSARFEDDHQKTRYLRREVMRFDLSQQPISQMTTGRYTFVRLITSLQENLQLYEDMGRVRAHQID